MAHQATGEDRLEMALAPLYSDTQAIDLLSERERGLEAERVHTCMTGRPEADRLLRSLSAHKSCQLSAIRNVLLTLAQKAASRSAEQEASSQATSVVA